MSEVRRDELERITAYHDFRTMVPAERSVDALWRRYVAANQAGESVPTTTRSKIYQWSREDRWKERLVEEEQQRQEAEQQALLGIRKHQHGQMTAMLPEANRALLQLIQSATDEAVRLRAITALYDRLGIVPESRTAAAKKALAEDEAAAAPAADAPEMPGPDGTEAEWASYLHWHATNQQ